MKFSEQWLREWVNPKVSRQELADQLTMAGLEVDAIDPVAGSFSGVVVAEVLKVEPHPDADKLRVCQVDAGGDETLQIVCGAPNVAEGMHVPAAVVGARLPGDFKIKKAKLRGVESRGMLCSASELGLAESSEGLMPLPDESPVGADLRDYLQLDDATIELGLTPNRGDCLSIMGIAREVGVLNRTDITEPEMKPVAPTTDDAMPVSIEAQADCPRYLGRIITGIDSRATTPLWMQERLRRCGLRSLGPVVDVTNYILLELGQPMHAFDLAKIDAGIVVRKARDGEKLTLLNDSEITLDSEALVIADETKPLALAGIMGGADSAVGDDTSDIFLEAAFFAPEPIAGRARRFGLHTDSSHRFERGVSPELAQVAIERATELLLQIVGGAPGPLLEKSIEEQLPTAEPITLRHARIERVIGTEVASDTVDDILKRLSMQCERNDEGWQVTPPPFRFDIAIEEDLIEEVARIIGYNNISSRAPVGALSMQQRSESNLSRRVVRQLLVERGYQEAITYSFVDAKVQKQFEPDLEPLALANPISQDMGVMRLSLWPGLVSAMTANLSRQQERVRLFEIGLSFRPGEQGLEQKMMIGGVLYGTAEPEQWDSPARKVDFFDVKGDIEALLVRGGDREAFTFRPETHTALHPGQSAAIYRGEQRIGWVGALHPSLEKPLEVPGRAFLFEMELEQISDKKVAKFREISKFPAIRRDLAIVVERDLAAEKVLNTVKTAAPDYLTNLKLFDVYQGEHIDSGRKSLALGLTLQAQSRTLTDDEVESAIEGILKRLKEELGATLRE